MSKVLTKSFFNRSTLVVTRDLLGKFLVMKPARIAKGGHGGQIIAKMITEVEAYVGPADRASHASKGKTKRTEIMFGPAGRWYVYLIYGMYWMLNIVTEEKNYPAAILIRGVEGYNGPGKLTKALGITKKFNNKLANKKTRLWIEDRGVKINPRQIKKSARIGVAYAGPEWANKEYRFYLGK